MADLYVIDTETRIAERRREKAVKDLAAIEAYKAREGKKLTGEIRTLRAERDLLQIEVEKQRKLKEALENEQVKIKREIGGFTSQRINEAKGFRDETERLKTQTARDLAVRETGLKRGLESLAAREKAVSEAEAGLSGRVAALDTRARKLIEDREQWEKAREEIVANIRSFETERDKLVIELRGLEETREREMRAYQSQKQAHQAREAEAEKRFKEAELAYKLVTDREQALDKRDNELKKWEIRLIDKEATLKRAYQEIVKKGGNINVGNST